MNDKQKRQIYWMIEAEISRLTDGCMGCEEIDCGKSYIHKMLKPKHRMDVIDHKQCLKENKRKLKELKLIVKDPMFKQARQRQCHHCKKKYEPEQVEFGVVDRDYRGMITVDHFCKQCSKKYKIKTM